MTTFRVGFAAIAAGFLLLIVALLSPLPVRSQQSGDLFQRIASALEAYALDNNGVYPPDNFTTPGSSYAATLSWLLTTPVAYLAPQDLKDPFGALQADFLFRYLNFDDTFKNSENLSFRNDYPKYKALHGSWVVWSNYAAQGRNPDTGLAFDFLPYDPTNGVNSMGTRYRSQIIRTETGVTTATE